VEVVVVFALVALIWMIWQYHKARKFTQFKRMLVSEIKPKLFEAIKQDLTNNRSESFPNNDTHIAATLYYWGQYPARILQGAIIWEVVDEQWLKDTGNVRNSQHLFHIQQNKLNAEVQNRQIQT